LQKRGSTQPWGGSGFPAFMEMTGARKTPTRHLNSVWSEKIGQGSRLATGGLVKPTWWTLLTKDPGLVFWKRNGDCQDAWAEQNASYGRCTNDYFKREEEGHALLPFCLNGAPKTLPEPSLQGPDQFPAPSKNFTADLGWEIVSNTLT
jgi:hypothetical protein